MLRIIYTFLWYLLLPGVFFRLWWRGKKASDYRKRWRERLGFYPQKKYSIHPIWVHAVSLGEVIAIVPLVKKLLANDQKVLITTMTPTGSRQVVKEFADSVQHVYLPYDIPGAIKRFLNVFQPAMLLIAETELWPNLLHFSHQESVPILLANARMSEKSARGYQRISWVTRQIFSCIDQIAAQTNADRERFVQLGYSEKNILVTGNIKYDLHMDMDTIHKAKLFKSQINSRLVWLAASTHAGEEEIILGTYKKLRDLIPNLLLSIVPRHPERFADVYNMCVNKGWKVLQRTKQQSIENDVDIFLGDTLGELMWFYAWADVVFVGGSLVPTGGHNLIEPANLQKPIITGPYLFNFSEVSRFLLEAKAMLKIQTADELYSAMLKLLTDPDYCKELGHNAKQIADQNRGAVERLYQLVQKMVDNKKTIILRGDAA